MGWVVNATPRPLYPPGETRLPIVQGVGLASGPVWMGRENLAPTGIRSPTVQPIVSRYTDGAIPTLITGK